MVVFSDTTTIFTYLLTEDEQLAKQWGWYSIRIRMAENKAQLKRERNKTRPRTILMGEPYKRVKMIMLD